MEKNSIGYAMEQLTHIRLKTMKIMIDITTKVGWILI